MNNNDVLRRVRYTFDISDSNMIALFAEAGAEVTRAQVSDWLKKEDDPAYQNCTDEQLATFLNGLINDMRGKNDGPQVPSETTLTNNSIMRKLKIALDLQADDMLAILALAEVQISKHELSALFRKSTHKNFRECKDQLLRAFLLGLQLKFRERTAGGSQ